MELTYRKLLEYLNKLNDEQLDMDVIIHDIEHDEFCEIQTFVGIWKDLWPDNDCPANESLKEDTPYLEF